MPAGVKIEDTFAERQSIYLTCEEMDFVWDEKDIVKFRELWREGRSIEQIGAAIKRDPDEVLILAIDQSRQRFITRRKGGLLGNTESKNVQPLAKPVKTKNDVVTVFEIEGKRYVLENKSKAKGAKKK